MWQTGFIELQSTSRRVAWCLRVRSGSAANHSNPARAMRAESKQQVQAGNGTNLVPMPNPNPGDDVLDAEEVAQILRIHPVTVRLKAAAGQIPGRQIGNRWRFSRRRLTEWLEAA